MGQKIKTFSDGSFLEYAQGGFDSWCVYYTDCNDNCQPPKDKDYFKQLQDLASKYGEERLYKDFVKIYELTGKEVEKSTLATITSISSQYPEDALKIDVIFSILYAAMISEERKEHTRLGKRIKRLGVHVLLIDKKSVDDSAIFMRGMGWRDIDQLCRKMGF